MTDDRFSGDVLDDGLLDPGEDQVFRGRTSWSARTVDTAVLERSFDQRLLTALRRCAGVFRAARMDYSAQLLVEAAKTLERLVSIDEDGDGDA